MHRIKETYSQAVELWVYEKLRDKNNNPADGIIFSLTDSVRPSEIPEPGNTVQLCEVLAQINGWSPLTEEDKKAV